MPLVRQNVITEAWVKVPAGEGDHVEPPIYIPIEPPLGIWGPNDPRPTPPIYIPAPPPGGWEGVHPMPPIYLPVPPPDNDPHPENPIYWPVYIEHPIVLPPAMDDLPEVVKEKLRDFLTGNLPEYAAPH